MKDYKKKYEEALERAKKIHAEKKAQPFDVVTKIFPELKESENKEEELTEFEKNLQIIISEASHWTSDDGSISTYCQFGDKEIKKISGQLLDLAKKELKESEDEKIRRDIIRYLKKTSPAIGENIEKMIAWLEKQGEQKHAWSEEDEETLDYIIDYIENNKSHDKIYTKKTEILEGMIDWLKSLKERYTWKPSDEQMEALWNAIPNIPNSEKDVNTITELSALYEELKTL